VARLLNPSGDVTPIAPSADAGALTESVAPHLEHARAAKILGAARPAQPTFQVRLSVLGDRRDFRIGEKIVYEVYSEEDAHLLLLNLDRAGNLRVILPNRYSPGAFVKGGTSIQVPSEQDRRERFEFQFLPPAGVEITKVIATSRALQLGSLDLAEAHGRFKVATGVSFPTGVSSAQLALDILGWLREQSVDGGLRWSEDTVVVRSHE
jgi:hypothetical protein